MTKATIKGPRTPIYAQRRVVPVPSSLLRAPSGIPSCGTAGNEASAVDVDVDVLTSTPPVPHQDRTSTFVTTPSSTRVIAILTAIVPAIIEATGVTIVILASITTTIPVAAAIVFTISPTISPPPTFNIHRNRHIRGTIVIVVGIYVAAAIVTTARVIILNPISSPWLGAPTTSRGGGPPRGADVASGVVVALPARPPGGGDNGRGVPDEAAAAVTTNEIAALTNITVTTPTTSPPALVPSFLPRAITIDINNIATMDDSSLLLFPMAATTMVSVDSIRGCGSVSGFPHWVRRIAYHASLPPSVVESRSA